MWGGEGRGGDGGGGGFWRGKFGRLVGVVRDEILPKVSALKSELWEVKVKFFGVN